MFYLTLLISVVAVFLSIAAGAGGFIIIASALFCISVLCGVECVKCPRDGARFAFFFGQFVFLILGSMSFSAGIII